MQDYSIQLSNRNKRDAKVKTGNQKGIYIVLQLNIASEILAIPSELFFSLNPYSGSLKTFPICSKSGSPPF